MDEAAAARFNFKPVIEMVLPLNLAGLEVKSTGLTVIAPCAIAALARATMLKTNKVIFFMILILFFIWLLSDIAKVVPEIKVVLVNLK